MKDMTNAEIQQAFKFPGLVEWQGKWWVADRLGVPENGTIVWSATLGEPTTTMMDWVGPGLILKTVEVPPRPSDELLHSLSPENKIMRLGEKPVIGKYAGWVLGWTFKDNEGCHTKPWYCMSVLSNYRWPVIIEDEEPKVVEAKVPVTHYVKGGSAVYKVVDGVVAERIIFNGVSKHSAIEVGKRVILPFKHITEEQYMEYERSNLPIVRLPLYGNVNTLDLRDKINEIIDEINLMKDGRMEQLGEHET